ncbi:MAG: hydrogenase nickel incorporation protein HypB, partial [Deltaproteobacteria bacterium]|nr:hydrogenase nickel incorporation protein HypB [Deltaproteobacteria bacterium]
MGEIRLIEIREEILSDNKEAAEGLRGRLKQEKTFLLNLMSSPGAGKTSLILKTIEKLASRIRIGVLEADIDSVVDAEKVSSAGVPAVQIRTGGFCHLDASMVMKGLEALDTSSLDLVIIENVGNLVCPA